MRTGARSFTRILSNPNRVKQRHKRFTPGVQMEEHDPSGQQREDDNPINTYTASLQNAGCVKCRGWAEEAGQGLGGN